MIIQNVDVLGVPPKDEIREFGKIRVRFRHGTFGRITSEGWWTGFKYMCGKWYARVETEHGVRYMDRDRLERVRRKGG